MKITINNSINFSSHNKDVRKTDDIARKVKNEFTAHSPSYALETWASMSEASKSASVIDRRFNYLRKYCILIDAMRKDYSSNPIPINDVEYCSRICDSVKDLHLANCFEYSMITLAALYANGYKDVYRATPMFIISLFDKQGKTIKTQNFQLDHACNLVKLRMFDDMEKFIVVDSWLGKAIPYSEILGEYINVFLAGKEEKYLTSMDSRILNPLRIRNPILESAIKNKRYKCSVDFCIKKPYSDDEKLGYKKLIQERYKELILDK